MDQPDYRKGEEAYLAAVENVVRERVRFAQEWAFSRAKVNSDFAATQMTIDVTKDALTTAQAHMKIMEARLGRGEEQC